MHGFQLNGLLHVHLSHSFLGKIFGCVASSKQRPMIGILELNLIYKIEAMTYSPAATNMRAVTVVGVTDSLSESVNTPGPYH